MAAGAEDIHRLFAFEQHRRERPSEIGELLMEDRAARLFAKRHAGRLLYCHETGAWYGWTGTAWERDRLQVAFHWARELARELCRDENPKTRFIASKTSFAAGVERFCRADPAFAVTADIWDRDPLLLGTPG